MTLYPAVVKRSIAGYSDPGMLVLSRDEAQLAIGATDFIFDFTDPACWPGGAFPALNTAVPADAKWSNLARDAQPLITVAPEPGGRTLPVTLSGIAGWVMPVYDGLGARFIHGTTQGLVLYKGTDRTNPGSAKVEGFVDVLETAWIKPIGAQSGFVFARDGYYGIQVTPGGNYYDSENFALIASGVPDGSTIMVGRLIRFDHGLGTSSIRTIFGASGRLAMGDPAVGKPLAAYPDPNGFYAAGAQSGDAAGTFGGTILRLTREYVGLAGLSDAAVLARLQAEYAWGTTRYGA